MFFTIVFFKDIKKAKIMAIVTGMITLVFLLLATVSFLDNFIKKSSYINTTAIVSNIDFSNKEKPYTEFTYNCNNQKYIVSKQGYSFRRKINTEVEILCKPSNPKQITIASDMRALPQMYLAMSGITLIFSVPMIINYILVFKKSKQEIN